MSTPGETLVLLTFFAKYFEMYRRKKAHCCNSYLTIMYLVRNIITFPSLSPRVGLTHVWRLNRDKTICMLVASA